MKQRVSEYIADLLVKNNITDIFTVTGGGAMYLNDSFGHHPNLLCTYYHHEQAAAIAAEAYARLDNRIAAVCVSTGPGATNAITGALCGWMDSIPMLIISGQARYETTIHASGLKLRTRGVQEFDIINSVKNMTKYCELIKDPKNVRCAIEKALHLATTGRPGPCWLDIPLDIQGAVIEVEDLKSYIPDADALLVDESVINEIINHIKISERPVLFAGNGIRLAGAHKEFISLVEKLNIPVVTGVSSVDAIATDNGLYMGRIGNTGDRTGNFAVQNSDLFISIGSRLSFSQTGFNYRSWAREAYKIVNDIDDQELEKDSINADMKICCDAKQLINGLLLKLQKPLEEKKDWTRQCRIWKERYPVVLDKHWNDSKPNIYAFYDCFTRKLGKEDRLVISVGTSRVAGSQATYVAEGMRLITNPSTVAMGYCLPAAIGVCIANNRKKTYLVTGDGSFQMNVQELQTIAHNKLPIIIFVMNNQGYHSIRMTQKTYFGKPLVGIGPESKDLSFPDLEKLSFVYGLGYKRCRKMEDMENAINWAMSQKSACICEMMLSTSQIIEPKAASKKLPDGSMVSAPLEDMAPFLPEEELKKNMYIKEWK